MVSGADTDRQWRVVVHLYVFLYRSAKAVLHGTVLVQIDADVCNVTRRRAVADNLNVGRREGKTQC